MKNCNFLFRFAILILVVLSFEAMAGGLMTEKEMREFRQKKYKDHNVLYEDASIQVLARKDCGYQDVDYIPPDTMFIERQRLIESGEAKRKTVTVLVYHKNKDIDERVVKTSSPFEKPDPEYQALNIEVKRQAFEPNKDAVRKALTTYVPKLAARCNKADAITAKQEFFELEKSSHERVIEFDTYLTFKKDGNEWVIEDSSTTRYVEKHTKWSMLGNWMFERYYNSIRNPNYTYYDGVFLRDNKGVKKLPGITYKDKAFWYSNYKNFGEVFRKVFEGYFDGATSEKYYHNAFYELIEANSVKCGAVLKGQVSVLTFSGHTRVTNRYGGSYDKDHWSHDVKLKAKYARSYKEARKRQRFSIPKLSGNMSMDMYDIVGGAYQLKALRDEAYRFLELSGCESPVANQLFENYYRSYSKLNSLQDDALK